MHLIVQSGVAAAALRELGGRGLEHEVLFPAHGVQLVADKVPGRHQQPRKCIRARRDAALPGQPEGVVGDLPGGLDVQEPAIDVPVDILGMQAVQFLHGR
ncbi:hypothetical protein [Arthrobacter sp. AQ5-05]|uniref:hypothetical protein n=1 Tax=Arthrobacter sp. AQ5-05 TaxID=2184581 RepID=UPI00256FE47B|nr:hypothetical protein [Arthrobacter sp. AQ5-05]